MKYTIVAPVGDYIEDLFVGIREFPTKKVILITPKNRAKEAQDAKTDLERFKIPTIIIDIKGDIWESIFMEVAKITETEPGQVMIHVSTGDRESRCAATSAAFVNGLRAFAVSGNEVMLLPVLKMSYYNLLSEKKMGLLRIIFESKDCCSSLEELSKKSGMSIPLISYHLNGNLKSEGLKQMGLIDTEEQKGRTKIGLSFQGKMLLKGYVNAKGEN